MPNCLQLGSLSTSQIQNSKVASEPNSEGTKTYTFKAKQPLTMPRHEFCRLPGHIRPQNELFSEHPGAKLKYSRVSAQTPFPRIQCWSAKARQTNQNCLVPRISPTLNLGARGKRKTTILSFAPGCLYRMLRFGGCSDFLIRFRDSRLIVVSCWRSQLIEVSFWR